MQNMKMLVLLLFAAACVLALAGCSDKPSGIGETAYFEAYVKEASDSYLMVEPLEDTAEGKSSDRIEVATAGIKDEASLDYLTRAQAGDVVSIGYDGSILESYPARIQSAFEIKPVEKAAALSDKIPMVMVSGKLYYDTGRESTVTGRCGVMDGEITSTVDASQTPSEDNQSNFGKGYGYQFGAEATLEILINDKWFVFEPHDNGGGEALA